MRQEFRYKISWWTVHSMFWQLPVYVYFFAFFAGSLYAYAKEGEPGTAHPATTAFAVIAGVAGVALILRAIRMALLALRGRVVASDEGLALTDWRGRERRIPWESVRGTLQEGTGLYIRVEGQRRWLRLQLADPAGLLALIRERTPKDV